jgi:hypothetical protein
MLYNTINFLNNAKRIHLKSNDELLAFESIPVMNVRSKLTDIVLDGFTDDGKALISKVLDDICNNVVGNTMFMMLVAKKDPSELTITNIGPKEINKLPTKQEGSSYSHTMYSVKINLNVYNRLGVGIPERQYYCIDERGNLTLKLKSLSGSIFHEFTHCLHYLEDASRCIIYSDENSLPDGNPWTDKEERRTITGYIEADDYEPIDTFDPICDNCFHLYNVVAKVIPHLPARPIIVRPVLAHQSRQIHPIIPNRVPKTVPYRPRFGHCGYRSDISEEALTTIKTKLQQLYNALNFNLAWQRKYMIK